TVRKTLTVIQLYRRPHLLQYRRGQKLVGGKRGVPFREVEHRADERASRKGLRGTDELRAPQSIAAQVVAGRPIGNDLELMVHARGVHSRGPKNARRKEIGVGLRAGF